MGKGNAFVNRAQDDWQHHLASSPAMKGTKPDLDVVIALPRMVFIRVFYPCIVVVVLHPPHNTLPGWAWELNAGSIKDADIALAQRTHNLGE